MKDDQPDRFERLDKFIAEKFNSYSDEKLRGIESLSREIRIRSSLLPKTDQSPKEMLASGIQSKAEQLKPPVSFDMDIENKAWHEYQRVYILPGPRTEQLFENSASHAAMPGPDASSDLYALKVWADSRILPLI
jgi:hypothetical protein